MTLLAGTVAAEFPITAQAAAAAAHAASARAALTLSSPPAVYAVDPNSGPTLGGTAVTIYGAGFTSATAVKFGSVTTISCGGSFEFFVISDTQIFVTSPPAALGTVNVVVVGPGGSSTTGVQDRFTYVNPSVAVVNGISPNSGPTAGGTFVEIKGTGFTNATGAFFGTTEVFGFAPSDTIMEVTSPSGAAGTVNLTVLTPSGTSAITNADKFTFTTPGTPVVHAVFPNSATAAGGTTVAIVGAGFSDATAVHFGTTALGAGAIGVNDDSHISVTAPPGTPATTVHVTVTTPSGTSVATNADQFSYLAPTAPVVNGVMFNHAPSIGGTEVDLIGSGFSGATSVKFGANAATAFTIVDDGALTVTSPPGAVGTVNITVTTPVGTSAISAADHFTYVATPIPVVYGVAPNSGSTAGQDFVSIFGSGFTGMTSVHFGINAATDILNVLGDSQIDVLAPPGVAGTVDVTVTTPGGTSAANAGDKYTYKAPGLPVVNSVIPNHGAPAGGDFVELYGSGFTGATAVSFGAVVATNFNVFTDTQLSVESPPGTNGATVAITVTSPVGTSALSTADHFTYVTPGTPVVTAISPSSGSASGGTTVWISGTALSGVLSVEFGTGNNAGSWDPVSDNVIEVFGSPAGTLGTVDVTVTTGGGTSANTSADHFTYTAPSQPAVASVSPSTGPASGGSTVYVSGSGFEGASAVNFGAVPAGFFVTDDHLITATSPAGSVGTVNITVVGPGGTSPITANDQFTYTPSSPPPGPVVTAVSPSSGSTAGGSTVYITGTNFTAASEVDFGINAAGFFVSSDNLITVSSTPSGIAGTVDVTVVTSSGTSAISSNDHYTYVTSVTPPVLPVVSAVDPNTGSSSGGTSVTIFGSGFSGATAVQFGSSAAFDFFPIDDTQIAAISPAGPAGTSVDVTVTTSAGTSATSSADSFTYVTGGPPVVNAVDPNSGTRLGGTTVTIFGSGFSGATGVRFGSTLTFPMFFGDTQLVVTTPAGAVGPVDVTVTTPGGTSATSNADKFTYVAPGTPVIEAVSPNRGGTAGGRMVRVFGTGLSGATAVHFGTAAATTFGTVSDNELDVTSPPGAVGTVHVTVTTPSGISVAGPADQYTYFVAPAPSITAVSPNSGPAGTEVFITGTGLSDATSVLFGNACAPINGGTDTSLLVFAPPGPTGTVDVTVISPDGTSAITVNDRFTYTSAPVPTVTYVAPASGPSGGGTTVFISGTGLAGVTDVMFGSAPAGPGGFFAFDDGLIQAASPAGTNGATVDVRVTSPGGTSAITSADHFTYGPTPVPSVTAVSPNSGPSGGGSDVFVTGSGFLSATQMMFGTTVLTPCFLFFGRTSVPGGSSPTILTPRQAPSLRVPIATRHPIHDPRAVRTSQPRFATVLVPSVAHRLLTGLAPKPVSKRAPAPLAGGPPPCVSGFEALTDNLIRVVSPAQGTNPATVDVTVTNPGGTSAVSAADHYTYVTTPAPVVSAVSPSSGPSSGGTTVFVSGSNLELATAVTFGSNAAFIQSDPFLFFFGGTSDSLIEVLSPPGTNPSTVDVTVTTAGGTSATSAADHFTYGPTPAPSVSAVSPGNGPIGTTVFITGTGFLGATAVDFGGIPAIPPRQVGALAPASGFPGFFVISDDLIQATSPSHSLGTVHVTVITAGGTSATSSADQYTYTASPTPTVTAVSPNQGVAGTVVYVTGSGLTDASAVSFGATSATFVFVSDTLIQATSPAGSGSVDVTVTTPGGTSAISVADQYSYGSPPPAPTVTSVVPSTGPSAGGTSVTITGTNFTGATAVSFGATAATTFTVNSATQITATSPAGSGIVDVTVTTADGTSATSVADKFTYTGPPTVSSVVPNRGPTVGGTSVTITGTNFTGATAVSFGTTAATTFTVNSATQITATSPAGSSIVDVTVTTAVGTSATSVADQFTYTAPSAYTAQSPNRLLDTRISHQTLGAGGSLLLTVAGGTTGVPITATGVVLNVTVTSTTASSFLTVWPAGQARPLASNLNWVAGETRPNLVNVSVGASGQVSIYNGVGQADVIVDEEGYFAAPVGTAGGYNALAPARLLDTRPAQTMSSGSVIDLQILGAGGVPATGVSAVVLNVTATNTATSGFLTLYPSGGTRPTASNVNWAKGWTVANRVIVKVGANGKVAIYNGQGSVDVVIDVNGYFTDATAAGKFFTPLSPVRVLDTRVAGGTIGPNGTYPNFQVTGTHGVPAGATAVFLNTTVTNTTASSFLTVYPNAPKPTASDLNWKAGQTIPNLTLATLSSTGSTNFYNGAGRTDLVLDLSGYFS